MADDPKTSGSALDAIEAPPEQGEAAGTGAGPMPMPLIAAPPISAKTFSEVGIEARTFLLTFAIVAILSFSIGPRTSVAPLSLLSLAFARSGERAYAMLNSMGAASVMSFPLLYDVFIVLAGYLAYLGWRTYKESVANASKDRRLFANIFLSLFLLGSFLHIATDFAMIAMVNIWAGHDLVPAQLERAAMLANTCIIAMLILYTIVFGTVSVLFFGSPLDEKTKNWLIDAGSVFTIVRPTLTVAVIVISLISVMDQSAEVLRVAAQDVGQSVGGNVRLMLLTAMILTFGLTNRFWTEKILIFHRASLDREDGDGIQFGYNAAPMVAGLLPIFVIGMKFITASTPLIQTEAPIATLPVSIMWALGTFLIVFSVTYSLRFFNSYDNSRRSDVPGNPDVLETGQPSECSSNCAGVKTGRQTRHKWLTNRIEPGAIATWISAHLPSKLSAHKSGAIKNHTTRGKWESISAELEKISVGIDQSLPKGRLRYVWLVVGCVNILFYFLLPIALPFSSYQSTQLLGPLTILLAGFASLSATISILAIISRKTALPVLTALVVWCLLNTGLDLNDDHQIREVSTPRSPFANREAEDLPTVQYAFRHWLESRPDLRRYWPNKQYPVLFIAAEGGGIRAAYQTAQALTQAETRFLGSDFDIATHTFVISGVSGGSVGAAVFASMIATEETHLRFDRNSRDFPVNQWEAKTNSVLGQDLLSPAFASLLFGETVQSVWPAPVEEFDRARAQEISLERAWAAASPEEVQNPLSGGFYQLYFNPGGDFRTTNVPFLVLNTTRVETGDRMIVSPFRVKDNSKLPDNLISLMEECRQCNPSLSTAAFLSARFPYVSPPGFVEIREGGRGTTLGKKRYADGGIYENSGAATLADIVNDVLAPDTAPENRTAAEVFTDWSKKHKIAHSGASTDLHNDVILPIIVRIGFDYSEEDAGTLSNLQAEGMNEVLAPLRTVLSTKDARGRTAVSRLSRMGTFVNVPISTGRNPLILGWLISKPARDELTLQIEKGVDILYRRLNKAIRRQDIPAPQLKTIGPQPFHGPPTTQGKKRVKKFRIRARHNHNENSTMLGRRRRR